MTGGVYKMTKSMWSIQMPGVNDLLEKILPELHLTGFGQHIINSAQYEL